MIQTTKIFIGCLPGNTEQEEIHLHFSKYCEIIKLKIKSRSNGVCAGYGHFTTKISDQKLKELLASNHMYKGRKLDCRVYIKGEKLKSFLEDFTSRKIYVEGIPEGTTDEELYHFFSRFCQVNKAYIANQKHTHDSVFGFVVANNKEGANGLIELEHVQFKGSMLKLSKSTCQKLESLKKGEKEKKLGGLENTHVKGNGGITRQKKKEKKTQINLESKVLLRPRILGRKVIPNRAKYYLKKEKGVRIIKAILPKLEHLGRRNLRFNKDKRVRRGAYFIGNTSLKFIT